MLVMKSKHCGLELPIAMNSAIRILNPFLHIYITKDTQPFTLSLKLYIPSYLNH